MRVQALAGDYLASVWSISENHFTRLATPNLVSPAVSQNIIAVMLNELVPNTQDYQAQLVMDGTPIKQPKPMSDYTDNAGNPSKAVQYTVNDNLLGAVFQVRAQATGPGYISSLWGISSSVNRLNKPVIEPLTYAGRTLTVTVQTAIPNADTYRAELVVNQQPTGMKQSLTVSADQPPIISGDFTIDTPVVGGEYQVRVKAEGDGQLSSLWVTSEAITPTWPALLTGLVKWNDTGVTGLNVQLLASQEDTLVKQTTTDDSGNFSFDIVTGGSYYITFDVPANTYWPLANLPVQVQEGAAQNLDAITLQKKLILTNPANNGNVDSNRPTLTWQAVAGSSQYRLDLIVDGTTTTYNTNGTAWSPNSDLLSNKQYTWSVNGLNSGGAQIAHSEQRTFTTPKPTVVSVPLNPSKAVNDLYHVENQWGGSAAPWHEGGMWVIGARSTQKVVAVNITSADNGNTFTGTMVYAGEGPIGFKASMTQPNVYTVQNQWGGNTAPWHPGGTWLLGARGNQRVVAVNVNSNDGGTTLTGTMVYAGEGPIGFRSSRTDGGVVTVENQWGGNTAPWHPGGVWVIGARGNQRVISINVTSTDNGNTLNGTMNYSGEGPIGFRANMVAANTYRVENQWGGNTAPWHPGGIWVLGTRVGQNVVAVNVTSKDDGHTLQGTMTYAGEGPIGFRSQALK